MRNRVLYIVGFIVIFLLNNLWFTPLTHYFGTEYELLDQLILVFIPIMKYCEFIKGKKIEIYLLQISIYKKNIRICQVFGN